MLRLSRLGAWLVSGFGVLAACSSTPVDPPAATSTRSENLVAAGGGTPATGDGAAPSGTVLGIQRMQTGAPSANAPPGCPAPVYFGGRVLAQPSVVTVYWGSGVDSTIKSEVGGPAGGPNFYSDILASSYVDWLTEYDTAGLDGQDGNPGQNQTLTRGTYAGEVTITPSACTTSCTDAQIQAELVAQLQAGNLPPPATDCAGNPTTIYMIEFPTGVTITLGGEQSCVKFCAYHGTTTYNGASLPYSVMPFMGAGSACAGHCGAGTYGQYLTAVTSHELIEAITDTEIGLTPIVQRPIAWYSDGGANCGELGDLCNAQDTAFTGPSGAVWQVQKIWSNVQNGCTAGYAPPPVCDTTTPTSPAGCRKCTCVDEGTTTGCNGASPHCETDATNLKYEACVQCTTTPQCAGTGGGTCQKTASNSTDDTCSSCVAKTTCPAGDSCGTVPDGCGGTLACLPGCTLPQTCGGGGTPNVCGCTPTACPAGDNCGSLANGCGGTVTCGLVCFPPQTCGGGGTANVCGCTPTVTSCPAGDNCGAIPNGCGGNISCGPACAQPLTCGGGGTPNVCGCSPQTMCPAGDNCGAISNGCGGTITCGPACSTPLSCGGGGAPNVCGCVPTVTSCPAGENCGTVPDGCGGTVSCGPACAAPRTCGGGGKTNVCGCTPATTCPAGQNCGSAPDGCGGTIACGVCAAPQTCGGGGGAAGTCGCTPEKTCAAGLNCGVAGDGCGGTISCGSCTGSQTCSGNVCVTLDAGTGDAGGVDSGSVDSGTGKDSGTTVDSGTDKDSGTGSDSGTTLDASTGGDSGATDSGSTGDSGLAHDSGATGDSGHGDSGESLDGSLDAGGEPPRLVGGCGCETVGESSGSSRWTSLGALALFAGFGLRRRRSRRKPSTNDLAHRVL